MIAVPAATPDTIPEKVSTEAVAVLLLIHVPPVGASVRLIRELVHTVPGPEIISGSGLTVTFW